MGLKAFRGRPFEHTHENRAFNELFDLLEAHCAVSSQDWCLLGNFYVGGRELDAMVIKPNALMILDFKAFTGKLQFSETGPWLIQVDENECPVEVKGGASINPLRQLRNNKNELSEFLGRNFVDLNPTCNWRHSAAVVAFQGPIDFDTNQLPGHLKPWFYITDMARIVRDLDAIVSREIFLAPESMARIVAKLGIESFVPAGGPKLRQLSVESNEYTDLCKLTQQQSQVLHDFSTWVSAGTGVFRLVGMASTGKRFLFPRLMNILQDFGSEPLWLTPSRRMSSTYHHASIEPLSIYTWLYKTQPSRFEKTKDGRKVGVHEIRSDIHLDKKTPVLVDAHLLSDEEFDVSDRRYGSGRLIQDFLSVIERDKTPFVVIGDPYQMQKGSLQRSLLVGEMLEQSGHVVMNHLLTAQVLSDDNDALSEFQAHLVDSLDKKRFNELPRNSGHRLEVVEKNQPLRWDPDTINVRAESILVCATHEDAAKVNRAVKTKILQHVSPYKLDIGDRVDFHNRTLILSPEDYEQDQSSTRWIGPGEMGLVDYVDTNIETFEIELRGRQEKIGLHFQCASCRVPGLGDVRFRYLLDYFESDKPDLSGDQYLALQVLARRLAKPFIESRKIQLPDKDSDLYNQARTEYDKFEHQILQSQGYLSAALIRPAHALTVHRAQGRHWSSVWVNASRSASSEKANNSDYFRWLYTASVCANDKMMIRQMPFLNALSNSVVSRTRDLKFGVFALNHGFFYDVSREPTEHESSMTMPSGFSEIKLVPLFLDLCERVAVSDWNINDWREYSYQVVIRLKNRKSELSISIRLHYNKKFAITNMVYLEGSDADRKAVESLLFKPFRPQNEILADAVETLQVHLAKHGFSVIDASESSYRAQLTLISESEGIEVEVYVDKVGMISSIKIMKAFSDYIAQKLESALAISS